MALNGVNGGNAVAAAIASNPAGIAPGTPVTNAQLQATWQAAITALYGDIKGSAVVPSTIPASAITTTGSSTTQTGPTAPVTIDGTIT